MTLSKSDWAELEEFLGGLGVRGSLINSPAFQAESVRFLNLLLEKNKEVNLTAVRDLESAFWKHLADSLALLSLEPLGNVVDWGSGGGLPGVPLALARKFSSDSSKVLFLDSVGKKMRAVEEFCAALELKNTPVVVGRGEELVRKGLLVGFNTVVMRAVAPPERAIKWLDKRIPHWIFFLGPLQREEWEKEFPSIRRKGFHPTIEKHFSLPRGMGERFFLRVSTRST